MHTDRLFPWLSAPRARTAGRSSPSTTQGASGNQRRAARREKRRSFAHSENDIFLTQRPAPLPPRAAFVAQPLPQMRARQGLWSRAGWRERVTARPEVGVQAPPVTTDDQRWVYTAQHSSRITTDRGKSEETTGKSHLLLTVESHTSFLTNKEEVTVFSLSLPLL